MRLAPWLVLCYVTEWFTTICIPMGQGKSTYTFSTERLLLSAPPACWLYPLKPGGERNAKDIQWKTYVLIYPDPIPISPLRWQTYPHITLSCIFFCKSCIDWSMCHLSQCCIANFLSRQDHHQWRGCCWLPAGQLVPLQAFQHQHEQALDQRRGDPQE